MPRTPHPAGLPSHLPQGGGARLVHRVRGTLRSIVAGGIALAGRLRRQAAPQPSRTPRALPRSPRSGRERTLFTPEAYPGISPEACAFFNTPVEQCDPELLRLILPVLMQHLAASLPAALGIDAKALFATLSGRLGAGAGEAAPDAPLAQAPEAEPPDHAAIALTAMGETTPDAAPLTSLVSRRSRTVSARRQDLPCHGSTWFPRHRRIWFDDPRLCWPHPANGATGRDQPVHHILWCRGPAYAPAGRARSFRHDRSRVRLRRSPRHRASVAALQHLPPRRLYYAACAGPS